MAIVVVEEGEKKADVASIVIWLALLAIIGTVIYFIFFKQPDLVEVVSPAQNVNIEPLSQVTINPEQVINSEAFKSLREYVPLPTTAEVGRPNPFLAP